MQSVENKTRPARLKRVLSLFIIALSALFLSIAIQLFVARFQSLWNDVLLFITDCSGFIAHAFVVFAIFQVRRLDLLTSRAQHSAIKCAQIGSGVSSLVYLLFAAIQVLQWIAGYSAIPSWLDSFLRSDGFFVIFYVVSLAAMPPWLVFVFSPSPSFALANWSGPRENRFRMLLFAAVVTPLIVQTWEIARIIGLPLQIYEIIEIEVLLITVRGWILFLGLLSILSLVTLLLRLRAIAHHLLPDPNHCPACAYPLDAHMTTCPECGHTRAAQHSHA